MTYYIRGRSEDGTVYAWVVRGKIKSWHEFIENASVFVSKAEAQAIVNRHEPNGWVYNLLVTER